MAVKTYDFVVIGGGSAGFNAARISASHGKKVAIIDGAKDLGGLCILRGCMPSKTLIYVAEVLHLASKGKVFGLKIASAKADMKAIHKRKTKIIGEFANDRLKQLTAGKFDLIRANAHFVDAHTLALSDGRMVKGKYFLIGTGSRVSVPNIPGLKDAKYWTSDELLEIDFIPKSVIVLGGGIVACELAQFLARIGTKVTIIQRGATLLRGQSVESAKVIQSAFLDEKIELFLGTSIESIDQSGSKTTVKFGCNGRLVTRSANHLFNALGRDPNTASLNLGAVGIRTRHRGQIVTNRWQQTTVPHIYAAGDCCGPHEIVHVAIQQGELAARHAAKRKKIRPIDYTQLMNVVFTDPQVASIGQTESDLAKAGVKHLTAFYPFNDHGKSILMDANYGYVRVHADPKKGKILGVQIVGKDAGELIHAFTGPMAMGATVFDMLKASWYHPTLSEIVTYPLEEIAEKIDPARANP